MKSLDIVIGSDVEYGLWVEGRGAHYQVHDSSELVSCYPGICRAMWDYRFEASRNDLRGFQVDKLTFDPEDAKFDKGAPSTDDRADRILPNGARFYSDHGHPEYASPECRSIFDLADYDWAGTLVVKRAAESYSKKTGLAVKLYRNNTDFHGASYGTHENYLVPRSLGAEKLLKDLVPLMVTRQILVGAGKVGSEGSHRAPFQLSQRADFMTEVWNVDTLYRRPIFNTRDEPHAEANDWIRLHVICGDVNMIAGQTALKFGVMKLGILLSVSNFAPQWDLEDPVDAFKSISQGVFEVPRVVLKGGKVTDALTILESYLDQAEKCLEPDKEMAWTLDRAKQILTAYKAKDKQTLARQTDWGAKLAILDQAETDDIGELRAYDLAYTDLDEEEGLFFALEMMDAIEANPNGGYLEQLIEYPPNDTRAWARGSALRFEELTSASWRSLVFGKETILLDPNCWFPAELAVASDVKEFINLINK